MTPRHVFLDACCIINLVATDRLKEVLGALPYTFWVSRYVLEEEVLLVGKPAADEGGELAPIDLSPLLRDGTLRTIDIETEKEAAELVRFARDLDDGEAHTLALATVRDAWVATDDRKAIRILREVRKAELGEGGGVLRTSELIFSWADRSRLADDELGKVLKDIEARASFFPPKGDPGYLRWRSLLKRS